MYCRTYSGGTCNAAATRRDVACSCTRGMHGIASAPTWLECCAPAGVYGLVWGSASLLRLTDSYWAQPRRVPSVPQCAFVHAGECREPLSTHPSMTSEGLPPRSSSGNGNTFRHVLGASPGVPRMPIACCAMSCPPTYLPTYVGTRSSRACSGSSSRPRSSSATTASPTSLARSLARRSSETCAACRPSLLFGHLGAAGTDSAGFRETAASIGLCAHSSPACAFVCLFVWLAVVFAALAASVPRAVAQQDVGRVYRRILAHASLRFCLCASVVPRPTPVHQLCTWGAL